MYVYMCVCVCVCVCVFCLALLANTYFTYISLSVRIILSYGWLALPRQWQGFQECPNSFVPIVYC